MMNCGTHFEQSMHFGKQAMNNIQRQSYIIFGIWILPAHTGFSFYSENDEIQQGVKTSAY